MPIPSALFASTILQGRHSSRSPRKVVRPDDGRRHDDGHDDGRRHDDGHDYGRRHDEGRRRSRAIDMGEGANIANIYKY